ncbi:MAG: hypothetical protein RJS97_08770 [Parvibaculaceae bacterium]
MAPKSPSNPKAAEASQSRPGNVSDKLERDQAASAYRKVMAGEKLSRAEQASLRRFEKDKEETLRWQYYNAIPQKHWREMSGRQTKVLHEQAERYGIPFGERTINLPKVVRALHDFFKRNAVKLAADDDLLSGESSPALERYREERAALARLDRLERERVLVNRQEIREGLSRIASVLRTAGDTLQRQYGTGALEILNEALAEAEREMERSDGGPSDDAANISECA